MAALFVYVFARKRRYVIGTTRIRIVAEVTYVFLMGKMRRKPVRGHIVKVFLALMLVSAQALLKIYTQERVLRVHLRSQCSYVAASFWWCRWVRSFIRFCKKHNVDELDICSSFLFSRARLSAFPKSVVRRQFPTAEWYSGRRLQPICHKDQWWRVGQNNESYSDIGRV